MNTHRAALFPSSVSTLLVYLFLSLIFIARESCAQGLSDVLDSPAMYKLYDNSGRSTANTNKNAEDHSNFGSIWRDHKGANALTTWLGVHIYGFKIVSSLARLATEYASAEVILSNNDRVRVNITVQVPRPSYAIMAQYKTLESFNRFRPPLLDSIAEQSIQIQGLDATYYRTRSGECSLLFNVERLGIVNLRVEKCINSRVMMDIAKHLNFERLNQKLTS